MAEVITVEQNRAALGEVFDEGRWLKQRIRDLEVRGHKRSQDVEDLLAGSVALSDDVDSQKVAITTLIERVGVLEYGMWTQALKIQELEQMLRMERGLRVGAVEQVAAIMGAS
jgi:hypothetical protein